jgi:hypothetical protein
VSRVRRTPWCARPDVRRSSSPKRARTAATDLRSRNRVPTVMQTCSLALRCGAARRGEALTRAALSKDARAKTSADDSPELDEAGSNEDTAAPAETSGKHLVQADRIVRNPATSRASESTAKAMALITPPNVDELRVGSTTIHGDIVHDVRGTDPTVYPRPFDDTVCYTVNPLGTSLCPGYTYASVMRWVLVYMRPPTAGVRAPVARPWEQSRRLFSVPSEAKANAAATLTEDLERYMNRSNAFSADMLMPRESIMRYLVAITLASETEDKQEQRRKGRASRHLGCPTLCADACTKNPRSFNGDEFVCRDCLGNYYCPLAAATEALFLWASRSPRTLPHLRAYYGSRRCVSYVSVGVLLSQFIDECLRILFQKTFRNFEDWVRACLVQACCAVAHAPKLAESAPPVDLDQDIPLSQASQFSGFAAPLFSTAPVIVPLPALPSAPPVRASHQPVLAGSVQPAPPALPRRSLPPVPAYAHPVDPVPRTREDPVPTSASLAPLSSSQADAIFKSPVPVAGHLPSSLSTSMGAIPRPNEPLGTSVGFLLPSKSRVLTTSLRAIPHPIEPPGVSMASHLFGATESNKAEGNTTNIFFAPAEVDTSAFPDQE